MIRARHLSMSRCCLLLAAALCAVLFNSLVRAADLTLLVTPSSIQLGEINASVEPLKELRDGLSVSVPAQGAASAPTVLPTLTVSISRPLTNLGSGAVLPSTRMQVGVDNLAALPAVGALTLPLLGTGLTRLRVAVALDRFDPPGSYEGAVLISSSGTNQSVEIPIKLVASKWAAVRVFAKNIVMTVTRGVEPGPEAFLSSGEGTSVQIAANCSWQLYAKPDADLAIKLGPGSDTIPAAQLRARVRRTEWVEPVAEGYVRLSNTAPTIIAQGRSTKLCGDGWAPVVIETRVPYGRDTTAGMYVTGLDFSIEPL